MRLCLSVNCHSDSRRNRIPKSDPMRKENKLKLKEASTFDKAKQLKTEKNNK
jgi:hypothetical protein